MVTRRSWSSRADALPAAIASSSASAPVAAADQGRGDRRLEPLRGRAAGSRPGAPVLGLGRSRLRQQVRRPARGCAIGADASASTCRERGEIRLGSIAVRAAMRGSRRGVPSRRRVPTTFSSVALDLAELEVAADVDPQRRSRRRSPSPEAVAPARRPAAATPSSSARRAPGAPAGSPSGARACSSRRPFSAD